MNINFLKQTHEEMKLVKASVYFEAKNRLKKYKFFEQPQESMKFRKNYVL